jgi:hypothetical protein
MMRLRRSTVRVTIGGWTGYQQNQPVNTSRRKIMGWKEDLSTLVSTVSHLEKTVKYLQTYIIAQTKKMGQLTQSVETLRKERGQSIDHMADRLIEMAMVNKGMSRDAAIHRRSLGEEPLPQDPWQDSPDAEWPPSGYDALNMP